MFGWLGTVFGSAKAIDKGLDMVSSGIDMAIFTDEEKTIANQKVLDWKLKWISATGPQSKARRVISFGIVGLWLILVCLAVGLELFSLTEKSKFVFEVLKNIMNWPFITIIGFYFAAHIVRTNKS
jgi:hypothetical protein